MSYYVKDSNGDVHSASPLGSINPFTAAVNFERIPEPIYDFGGSHHDFRSQVYMLPTIVIKDGSKPIYQLSYASTFPETANCFTDDNCKGFPWIGNFLLESNNNQYTCYTGSYYGGDLAYVWQFTNEYVSNKEIFCKDKALVEYVDRTKGNMLEWQLVDKNIINTYWPNKYGPWAGDNTLKENAYLRCSPNFISNGQVPSININAYTFNSDLFNDGSTFSPENIKTIRSIPERIDNDMFGFTNHVEQPGEFCSNGQNPISYFTLNVNDITSRGYTGLKLKLHYNILFNAAYNSNYEPQDLEKLQINNTNCCDSHPFIFNYFLSNSATWDYRTGEEGEGKCISDKNNPKFNLYSSIVKENGVWTAKDIDENHLYTFDVFDNKNTDPWGDIKTYNKFYVAKANTGNHYPFLHKVEFLGYNKTYYVCFDFNVGEYNSSNTYSKGDVIKYSKTCYIAQKSIEANTSPLSNNTTSPAYIDNPSNAPWIKLNIKKYTHDYSTEFEESKFLSACDKNKWGLYSGDFIPYFIVSSKNFYLDDLNNDYFPNSELTDTTTAYLNTNIWKKQGISDFSKTTNYISGYKSSPNFKRNNQIFSDLKYNYIGYKYVWPSNSNVIYTFSTDENIYFNSPYRQITQFNPLDRTDNSLISFYTFEPESKLTAGNWYLSWSDLSANTWAWIYDYNGSKYITQLSADIYGYRPDWCGNTARNDRIVYVNANNVLMLRYLTGSTTRTVVERATSIRDLFGPIQLTQIEQNFRYFFVKANIDSTFNTASNYDCSSLGEIYKTGELKFYKNDAYYVIFKNGPYLGNPEDYPPTGDEHIFYAYSANNYCKVEDNNYHQVINDRFFTNEFINNITTYYDTGWDSSTRYNRFDAVLYQAPGESNASIYYAIVDNTNSDPAYVPGPAPYSKNNIPQLWNESGYSLYNSKYYSYSGLQNYKNFNIRGNTEFTIDLTNTDDKQYIHIAYPSTTLLDSDNNSGKFPDSACHTFITDLKMTYEGIE